MIFLLFVYSLSAQVITFHPPSQMRGKNIETLTTLAKKNKNIEEIPFQIDERNPRGDIVLDQGLPFTKDTDDLILDHNDDISVRWQDIGTDVSPLEQKDYLKFSVAFKGEKRFFLVGAGKPKPQISSDTTLNHHQKITFSKYEYIFNKKKPFLIGEVFLIDNGKRSPVLSSSKFQMPLNTKQWWLPNLTFSDEDLTSEIESWKVGPLRTIVAVGVKYKKFFSLINLHLFSELIFTEDSFEIPTAVEFIFDPDQFLKKESGLAYNITFADHSAWNIETNLPQPTTPEAFEKVFNMTAREYMTEQKIEHFMAFSQHQHLGSFGMVVAVDPATLSQTPPPILFRPDANYRKELPLSRVVRSSGDLGIYLDIAGIKKGLYDFKLKLLLSTFHQEKIKSQKISTKDFKNYLDDISNIKITFE